MILPIISLSALEFWLFGSAQTVFADLTLENRKLVCLPEKFLLQSNRQFVTDTAFEYGLSLPVIVMAASQSGRKHTKCISAKTKSKNHPANAFIQLDNSVYVSCPELCFLQLSAELSLPRLIEAGNNLCAGYVRTDNTSFKQIGREPVASVKSIRSFLDLSAHAKGIKKSRLALKYVIDGAYSPMEGKLAVLVVLPLFLGGYGLKRPVLNKYIRLSPDAAALLKRETCCCDIVWEEEKVILEYDSNLTHLTKEQHSYDKRKYNALTMSGYKVFSVTADQIQNFKAVENLFENLRKALHIKSRADAWVKYEEKRWEVVHELLFSNNKIY